MIPLAGGESRRVFIGRLHRDSEIGGDEMQQGGYEDLFNL